MYLKTPKRYSAKRRKRYLFSYKRVLFLLLVPVIAFAGWYVYRERATFAPMVSSRAEQLFYEGSEMVSTMTAPTPLPTENPASVVTRADSNWMGGRIEDAIVDYEVAVESLPNDVVTHYRYTLGLIIEGRYEAALEAAEDAITADPYSSDAWAIRALAQARTGDAGGAIASGQHALELNPENANAYAFLTEAYLDLNQVQRAQEAAETAITMNPNSAEAYYARAQIQQLVNYDIDAAIADYSTAYELAPYWTDAAVAAGNLLAFNGNTDEAIRLLNSVKDANPDNPTILYTLGIIYNRDVGDPNQAADILARCVDVDEDNGDCHYWYGRVLIRLEQYGQASEMLDRAVQIAAENETIDPYYSYWAGEAQIYLGNCAMALNYLRPGYERAVEIEDESVATALQGSIRECSAFDTFSPTEAPAVIAATEEAVSPDA